MNKPNLIDLIPDRSQVILVSDYRQDNAEKLVELLAESAEDVFRLRVGTDQSNGYIANIRPPNDMQPACLRPCFCKWLVM